MKYTRTDIVNQIVNLVREHQTDNRNVNYQTLNNQLMLLTYKLERDGILLPDPPEQDKQYLNRMADKYDKQ